MTQGQLAAAAGLKQPDVSKLERGLIKQTTGIARLADALRVPFRWLEFGEGDTPDWDGEPVTPSWPFPRLPPTTWAQLTERQRGVVEDAAVKAVQALRAERPPPLAGLRDLLPPAGVLHLPEPPGKQVQRKDERRGGGDRRSNTPKEGAA